MGDFERFEDRGKSTPREVEWDHPDCYWPGCEAPIRTYYLYQPGQCWKGVCIRHKPGGLSNVARTVYAKEWDEVDVVTKRAIKNGMCER